MATVSKKTFTTTILTVIVLIALITGLIFYFSTRNAKDSEPTVVTRDVSQEMEDKLSGGSILTFGKKGAPDVSVIVDPQKDFSRDSILIDGKPSELLTAVQEGKINLHVYPIASGQSRATGVDSLAQATACYRSKDKTSTGIVTLSKMIDSAQNTANFETPADAMRSFGVKDDLPCAQDVISGAIQTVGNGDFFLNSFQVDHSALISGGGLVTGFEYLQDYWVRGLTDGDDVRLLMKAEDE